jgi:hypothetical protein
MWSDIADENLPVGRVATPNRVSVLLADVVKDSDPGYPYRFVWPCNGDVLKHHSQEIVEDAMRLIRGLLHLMRNYTAEMMNQVSRIQLLAQAGLLLPDRVFNKKEPHKREKLEKGLVRNIVVESVIYQIAERIVFGLWHRAQVDDWINSASAIGAGMQSLNQQQIMARKIWRIMQPSGTGRCVDCSHWDWTVQAWEDWSAVKIMAMQARFENGHRNLWESMARAMWVLHMSRCVVMGKELFLCLGYRRVTGSYVTSEWNTIVRLFGVISVHRRLFQRNPLVLAMGDDTVESDFPQGREDDYVAAFKKYHGKTIKPSTLGRCVRVANFCSFEIDYSNGRKPIFKFLNIPKMFYNYITNRGNLALRDEFLQMSVNDERAQLYLAFLRERGVDI